MGSQMVCYSIMIFVFVFIQYLIYLLSNSTVQSIDDKEFDHSTCHCPSPPPPQKKRTFSGREDQTQVSGRNQASLVATGVPCILMYPVGTILASWPLMVQTTLIGVLLFPTQETLLHIVFNFKSRCFMPQTATGR